MEKPARIPAEEADRLAAVLRYNESTSLPCEELGRIVRLAARLLGTPIAAISIVEHDHIRFVSRHGFDVERASRDCGMCASAILGEGPYIVEDVAADPRALSNALSAELGIGFYAAVPLVTRDGFHIGALCVMDHMARTVHPAELADLTDLAAMAMDEFELWRGAQEAAQAADFAAKEVDHRVMNSLQFVSSLLTLQTRSLEDPHAIEAIRLAAGRISAAAEVHRHFLTQAGGTSSTAAFLQILCDALSRMLDREIETALDDARVPATVIQPVGIMLNELVANAAKHGAGRIAVAYDIAHDRHSLTVTDEGEGLPADFDLAAPCERLGMRVIAALARQLRGSVVASEAPGGRGAQFQVSFPVIGSPI